MQTQYTPGPWALRESGRLDRPDRITGANGAQVASINAPLFPDARLIAAAPELVEALAWALEQIEDDLDLDHRAALAHARRVLARAQGGAT